MKYLKYLLVGTGFGFVLTNEMQLMTPQAPRP